MQKNYFVYIMASARNGTLYIGVTSDLEGRVWDHRQGTYDGFTKKYSVTMLVWYDHYDDINAAIQREKTMKKWPRKWKLNTIEKENPDWCDLYEDLFR
ncbi:MAG: GIY-YIG nuclease family protein [Alphaproteobacteria bacterium]|nr:GIY-YIG nuclease family protein [Alphaproteobacteria bacterium]